MMLIFLVVVMFVTSDVDFTAYIVIGWLIICKSILKSYILPYIPGYIVGQVNDLLLHGVQAEHLHRIVQVLPSLMMMKKIMMMIMRGWFAWHFPIMLQQSQKRSKRQCIFYVHETGEVAVVIFRQYMMMRCSEVFDNVGRWWSVVTENLWINGGLPQSSLIAVKYWLAPKLSSTPSTSQQKKSSPIKLLSFHCLALQLKLLAQKCSL